MNCSWCSSLLLLALFGVAQAQQKAAEKPRPPTKPQTPTVNCSEAQTSRACSSFMQLLEAHDTDILATLSSPTSYVCFRPSEDDFWVFHMQAPSKSTYAWKESDDGVGQTQRLSAFASLEEYRDGVLYTFSPGVGYWRRYSHDGEPTFYSESTEGPHKGLKIDIEATEISIDYPFKNQNGGTTQYSLTIRRSTGRFIETFSVEHTPSTTHSGTCLIYP